MRLLAAAAAWEVVVGIEAHVQIRSRLKLFSDGLTPSPNQEPNSCVHPFDIALPGTLPKINPKCIDLAIRAALALQSTCKRSSSFDRKHYFYHDLPAGYQITQKYNPFATGGQVPIGPSESVGISHIQLEQDTAKSIKERGRIKVDYNRSGCALLEIVSAPDMRSPDEASAYVKQLQRLLRRAGVTDGNMEDGSLRCDVNVSVNRPNESHGIRCEIKNLNSIKSISQSILCEAERHIQIIEQGGRVVQETRAFDQLRVNTYPLRNKEDAPDYRYMPDHNLPILQITPERIRNISSVMPESEDVVKTRLMGLGLTDKQIAVLLAADVENETSPDGSPSVGAISYFEQVSAKRDPNVVVNWMMNELLGQLSFRELSFSANPLSAIQLGDIIDLVMKEELTTTSGKLILRHVLDTRAHQNSYEIAKELGFLGTKQSLSQLCASAVESMPSEADAVRRGNLGSLNRLVGLVMRLSGGRANAPAAKAELLSMLTDYSDVG